MIDRTYYTNLTRINKNLKKVMKLNCAFLYRHLYDLVNCIFSRKYTL